MNRFKHETLLIMTPTHLPDFDSLTLTNRTNKSVTYLSFGTFDFQHIWDEFKQLGATSANIFTSPDNEAIEVDIFFDTNPLKAQGPSAEYAPWQYAVSAICVTGISLAAFM